MTSVVHTFARFLRSMDTCVRACAPALALCLAAFSPCVRADSMRPFPMPVPEWHDSGALIRHTFVLPQSMRFCTVSIPAEVSPGRPVSAIHVVGGDSQSNVNFSVRATTPEEIVLTLNTTFVAGGSTVCIYATGGEKAIAATEGGPVDPAPILGFQRRVNGQDRPGSWAAHMLQRRNVNPDNAHRFRAMNFDQANRDSSERGRRWNCVDFTTWIFVDNPGEYRFAVYSHQSTFLRLGTGPEEYLLEACLPDLTPSGDQIPPSWTVGKPVRLEPGLYRLDITHVYHRTTPHVVPGWVRPGETQPQPIPTQQLIAGMQELPVMRTERVDGVLHACFDVTSARTYSIGGNTNLFAALKVQSRTADWLHGAVANRWLVDGREVSTNSMLNTVVRGTMHELTLVARNEAGFTSAFSRPLPISPYAQAEYLAETSLQGVPALCHESDTAAPDIWVSGDAPAFLVFDVSLTLRYRDGSTRTVRDGVRLRRNWGRLLGPQTTVSELDGIDWELSHCGVTLERRSLHFVRHPHNRLPDRVLGPSLFRGDDRIALVLPERGPRSEPAPGDLKGGRIVLLDDFLGPRGTVPDTAASAFEDQFAAALTERAKALAEGGESDAESQDAVPPVTRVDLRGLGLDAQANLAPLAMLGGLNAFTKDDIVLVSMGREAFLDHEPAAMYEKRLSALCGLLTSAIGATVVCVTPPPFDGVDARPYAEAALRVADVYGLHAVDLYGAFSTSDGDEPPVAGLELTSAGRRLAIAKMLRAVRPE